MRSPHDRSVGAPAPLRLVSPPEGEFDALAELFLGGEPDTGSVPLAPDVLDAATITPTSTPTTRDAAESAALRGPGSTEAKAPAPRRPVQLELMIRGHLPVRAGPWVSQYARLAAERAGAPVALVRLEDGEAGLQLFGLDPARREHARASDLAQGVALASAQAGRWVLCVDEVHEAALAGDPRVGTITVLAGVNDAAVVAAYRTLKSLAPSGKDRDGPALQVAVMGASDAQAQEAIARIRQASSMFLSRPVTLAGSVAKVAPAGGATVFQGEWPGSTQDALELIEQHAASFAPASAARPSALGAPDARRPGSAMADHAAPRAVSGPAAPPAMPAPLVMPSPRSAPRAPGAAAIDTPAAQAPPVPAPMPARLCALVPGLVPLGITCPLDPGVELGVDQRGVLHLLVEETGDAQALNSAGERVLAAGAWARRHAGLLAMLRGVPSGLDASAPVLHVFTASPKRVAHLMETSLRLHVLAPGAGTFCAELN